MVGPYPMTQRKQLIDNASAHRLHATLKVPQSPFQRCAQPAFATRPSRGPEVVIENEMSTLSLFPARKSMPQLRSCLFTTNQTTWTSSKRLIRPRSERSLTDTTTLLSSGLTRLLLFFSLPSKASSFGCRNVDQ
jgi:hypothetical protein